MAKLASRFLPDLPPSQSSWACPYCGKEVKPVEWEGVLYRNPHCGCKDSYLAEQNKAISHDKREGLLQDGGFNQDIRARFNLKKFYPNARNISNGVNALKQVDNFCHNALNGKNSRLMALEGYYGTGKTHLACGAAMRVMYRKPTTGYLAHFVRINQAVMGDSSLINDYVSRMEKCGVLVIDDLDKKSPGKQLLEALLSVLEYRLMRSDKITIITTNHGLAKLHSYWSQNRDFADISAAITRRLVDMATCNIPLIGDAYEVQHG